jgi:ParB family transcriptional regulator, chromosome partitioning protein
MGHARAIAGVKNDKQKKELAEAAILQQWSVRELEDVIKKQEEAGTKEAVPPNKTSAKKDPYINQLEENLREQFRTTVKIKHQNNKGKIELMYYSKDDLERLLELLQGKIS